MSALIVWTSAEWRVVAAVGAYYQDRANRRAARGVTSAEIFAVLAGVGITVARQALHKLVEAGVLVKYPGSGNWPAVFAPRIAKR